MAGFVLGHPSGVVVEQAGFPGTPSVRSIRSIVAVNLPVRLHQSPRSLFPDFVRTPPGPILTTRVSKVQLQLRPGFCFRQIYSQISGYAIIACPCTDHPHPRIPARNAPGTWLVDPIRSWRRSRVFEIILRPPRGPPNTSRLTMDDVITFFIPAH